MKVAFKGRMNVKGKVRVVKKTRPAAKKTSQPSVRRVLRQEINRALQKIDGKLSAQRAGIRRDLRKELYSPRFGNFVGSSVVNAGNSSIRELAQSHVNKAVAVTTAAGTTSGTLIRVGDNFMVVQETPSTILVIPFTSVSAIRQL